MFKELDKQYAPEEFCDPPQPFTSEGPKNLVDAKLWTLRVNETGSTVLEYFISRIPVKEGEKNISAKDI